MTISVVIPTFQRPALLRRCILSVQRQTSPANEIIVVDDCSPGRGAEAVCAEFSNVRYLRQEVNSGPGLAREAGLRASISTWVLPLDDDDELVENALETVRDRLKEYCELNVPPVVCKFAVAGSTLGKPFHLATIQDYINRRIAGTFPPVLHKEQFLKYGLAYPRSRLGGESVLWWTVARAIGGIPIWNDVIMLYQDDAGSCRLTSPDNQIARAAEYADLQELIIATHGDLLETDAPSLYKKRLLGAATYWLLAGQKSKAAPHIENIMRVCGAVQRAYLTIIVHIPRPILSMLFKAYRKSTFRQSSP